MLNRVEFNFGFFLRRVELDKHVDEIQVTNVMLVYYHRTEDNLRLDLAHQGKEHEELLRNSRTLSQVFYYVFSLSIPKPSSSSKHIVVDLFIINGQNRV